MLATIFFIIGIYFNIGLNNDENSILFGEKGIKPENREDIQQNDKEDDENAGILSAKGGIAASIGKKTSEVEKIYGKPARIDPSSYGYDWWIYNYDKNKYFQLAVENGRVVSSYGIGKDINIAPFKIGQTIDEIYSSVFVETSVEIESEGSSYRFELSEEDMNMRPLIKLGKVYVQLYLDKFTGKVSSVRFLNEDTLLKQRPYEITYRGEMLEENPLSDEEWTKVENGNRQQIFDISNIMRNRFDLRELKWDEPTAEVAYLHSMDMSDDGFFSHTSPTKGELKDRLEKGDIAYTLAGENIAAKYSDAISVMEGWLNSKAHREALLNEEFTHLGVGVHQKYYTQNFIAKSE
ncbi:CAP domain-containing protein [Bacillus sp. V59.32b]|uniref:CAP domain-containing protein n=1 Tax=Bacillus sp. V59.32b TaxID=1758642 RepID=UPI0020B1210E|nr:CAP domain-containing protein [Bacillus sp. V59.32b]